MAGRTGSSSSAGKGPVEDDETAEEVLALLTVIYGLEARAMVVRLAHMTRAGILQLRGEEVWALSRLVPIQRSLSVLQRSSWPTA
jgi:hypothetical protein